LLTDFGLVDTYVGQMKGVILSIHPEATVVDITHDVRPQQIKQGAFLAQTAWHVFPPEAIHLAVVDPGVGTERRRLVIESEHGRYIGPDNGVLSAALPDEARPATAGTIPLPEGVQAYEILNEVYMRHPVSNTFHGRDVFSPAAAHLSAGVQSKDLGLPVDELMALPPFRARQEAGGLSGEVVHVDWYGNLITDIRSEDLPEGGFILLVAEHVVRGPYRTFAELPGLGAIVGGSGFLGIAAPNDNAAEALDVDVGEPVVLRPDG